MLKPQHGFTIVELLVALLISSLLFIGLISMYFSTVQHGGKMLNANRLYEQLSSAMELMSADIRRAGYWSQASTNVGTSANTNPFMASGVRLTISGGNCILFVFDNNADAALPAANTGTDDERYGYRLSNGVVQARPSNAPFDCAAANNEWENITDPNLITVTNLTFTQTQKSVSVGASSNLYFTYIDISLSGRLTNDSTVQMTLTNHIRVHNDRFAP